MIDFAKYVLTVANEIRKEIDEINPSFNWHQVEARVLETKLNGLLTELKTEHENRNYFLEEEAKYGNTGIPPRLRNAIKDSDGKITTLETEIREIKKTLSALDAE